MPIHDLIDNRSRKLADQIATTLDGSKAAHFAVGYFFLAGLPIAVVERLAKLDEVRLLLGSSTSARTIEQLAEGHRRLDLVSNVLEQEKYQRRGKRREAVSQAAGAAGDAVAQVDKSDEAERAVTTVLRLVEEKRPRVGVYTKGRLHSKAYIFDYGPLYDAGGKIVARAEVGSGIVGSSNLTLAGLTHNTELNVVVHGNDNHAALTAWFDELWDESEPFEEALMSELRQSWPVREVTPWELYMRTLYMLVRERLEGGELEPDLITRGEIEEKLADFQKVAVDVACQMIARWNGCFVSDVVGLGKSFVGSAIVKRFSQAGYRPLIVCPAALTEMWETYNEDYHLNAAILSTGMLSQPYGAEHLLGEEGFYRDRDFVLIDESHAFRSGSTQRYEALQTFLERKGRPVCLLTATPRNKSAWDVYHQIKLFHPEDTTDLDITPPHLQQYVREVEKGERDLTPLLQPILYRRRRRDVLHQYGYDAESDERINHLNVEAFRPYMRGDKRAYVRVGGRRQFFPQRKLETPRYDLNATYDGLYDELRAKLGTDRRTPAGQPEPGVLTFARYGLWHYLKPEFRGVEPYEQLHRAGANLRGLMRTLLFKRLESSVAAFRGTTSRMHRAHERFVKALDEEIVPAGYKQQQVLISDLDDEGDLFEALGETDVKYEARAFDVVALRRDLLHDVSVLAEALALVEPITPKRDDKLQTLLGLVRESPLKDGKRLVFTEFKDTARYLYEHLADELGEATVEIVGGADKSKARVVGRFAPTANPALAKRYLDGGELMTVVATDVFSEGLNLQDCDKIVNYDLAWNPVRLIQRFGRIDRIGSEFDVIRGYNFLPDTALDRHLDLRSTLRARIRDIHETIGEDARILESDEQLNEEAMFSVYADAEASTEDDEDAAEKLSLGDVEAIIRGLRESDPAGFEQISTMRDGVRSARTATFAGVAAYCEARASGGRDEPAVQRELMLLDEKGDHVTSEVAEILALLQCDPRERRHSLPDRHNRMVGRARAKFSESVRHRIAQRRHPRITSVSQRWVLTELTEMHRSEEYKDVRSQLGELENALRRPLSSAARRAIDRLRRTRPTGLRLVDAVKLIYVEHALGERADSDAGDLAVHVVTSETFV